MAAASSAQSSSSSSSRHSPRRPAILPPRSGHHCLSRTPDLFHLIPELGGGGGRGLAGTSLTAGGAGPGHVPHPRRAVGLRVKWRGEPRRRVRCARLKMAGAPPPPFEGAAGRGLRLTPRVAAPRLLGLSRRRGPQLARPFERALRRSPGPKPARGSPAARRGRLLPAAGAL